MNKLYANLLLLFAAILWGFGNVAQKTVLEHLDPFSVVGMRCLIAALIVVPYAMTHAAPRAAGFWPSLLAVSAFFGAAMALQQFAFIEASVTNASFLVNTATVMTPLLAWFLFGERPVMLILLAACATLGGILLLLGELDHANRGDLLALASAVFFALWMIQLGRHMRRYGDAPTAAGVQFLLAATVILPIGAGGGSLTFDAVVNAAPELLILGVFSTAIAFGIQTWAQRYTSASHAAVIVSAESVFGAIGGAAFLGERLSTTAGLGAAIVLTAIMLTAVRTSEPMPRLETARAP